MSPSLPAATPLRYEVLGPLRVLLGGQPIGLGGAHQRAILGLCLVNRNRVVSMDTLIEEIWHDAPPRSAVSSVHVAVSGLRRTLPNADEPSAGASRGSVLQTSPPGYRLVVDDACVDLVELTARRDRGAADLRAGRPEQAAESLASALALWRGVPLEDLQRFPFAVDFATALGEVRLLTLELRLDADLQCHRYEAVLPELLDLTVRHPLREELWAKQAVAFYHLGRQAEGLATLQRLREVLDAELGIDPSPAVKQLELDILRQNLRREDPRPHPPAVLAATVGEPTNEVASELVSATGEVFRLLPRTRVGRDPDSDVVIADDRASRQHAFIYLTPAGLVLSDLRSRNGTLLNGRRVVEDEPLHDGDVIEIGRTSLTLRALGRMTGT